ncbi:glycoside hydrolase family 47 protein [Thozetella sp. PMI_491]|nr:glycoside hydrolase family 47 protein [Thozetella sp. PMI_491]
MVGSFRDSLDGASSLLRGDGSRGGLLRDAIKTHDNPRFLWRTVPVNYPMETPRPLPSGRARAYPKIQKASFSETEEERKTRVERQKTIKKAMARCWDSYHHKAWMADELSPVTGRKKDRFGGWGATLIDSLDTLYIMGFDIEFEDAAAAAYNISFQSTTAEDINVFETNIRYLGGFLAAYELSDDVRMLVKAKEVGDLLYKAFDTPNHMPITRWRLHGAALGVKQQARGNTLLAEIGSLTMEFARLSMLTGDLKYFDAVQRIMEYFRDQQDTGKLPGMWPILIDAVKGEFNSGNSFSLNSMGDSMYEYLVKTDILLGGLLPMYEDMYKKAMDTALEYTIFRPMIPDERDILISGILNMHKEDGEYVPELDPQGQHLACFTGGMLAMSGRLYRRKDYIEAGQKLTDGCIWAYESMPSGIMPESFHLVACESKKRCPWNETVWKEEFFNRLSGEDKPQNADQAHQLAEQKGVPKGFATVKDPKYHLRPEAIESVFILYRITGRKELLETAWRMWTAIDTHTRTNLANSALRDVKANSPAKSDVMESFWLGETLKYFFLIFSDPELLTLDEWVFNTEAHPFKRYLP